MLNDVMKALTTRKPISLTTTSMCSGPFAARIARSQRLHELRLAVVTNANWQRPGDAIADGLFKTYGLDVQTTFVADAAAAIAALAAGTADVAFIDAAAAIRARAEHAGLQFVALGDGVDGSNDAYAALAPAIDAKRYAMSRFARAVRANGFGRYVDAVALQPLLDRAAAEQPGGAPIAAHDLISRVAEPSGTR